MFSSLSVAHQGSLCLLRLDDKFGKGASGCNELMEYCGKREGKAPQALYAISLLRGLLLVCSMVVVVGGVI